MPRSDDSTTPKAGIYRKFTVMRTDGSSEQGGKHEYCSYFVLDWEHDPFAVPAALAYASACEATYPELAKDLRDHARAHASAAPPTDAPALPTESRANPMMCGHANEVPFVCSCDMRCYCKSHTCQPRYPRMKEPAK